MTRQNAEHRTIESIQKDSFPKERVRRCLLLRPLLANALPKIASLINEIGRFSSRLWRCLIIKSESEPYFDAETQEIGYTVLERRERPAICWDRMVGEVTGHYLPQPLSLF